jgi:hypothetical protein
MSSRQFPAASGSLSLVLHRDGSAAVRDGIAPGSTSCEVDDCLCERQFPDPLK